MGEITIGDRGVEFYTALELEVWLQEAYDGYKIRVNTMSLWAAIMRVFDDVGVPMTVRQMFYRLVSVGAVDKDEDAYRKVARQLLNMRRRDIFPYPFISDNTRWMRRPRTYGSVDEMLKAASASYRRALWADQEYYVEVWLEKDALAGVLNEITSEYDVALMVTRGFPSETFQYEAAVNMKEQIANGKRCAIYYFGDYDPSGVEIDRGVEKRLRKFGVDGLFERVAVTPANIADMNLPTRPTKKTDSRSQKFGDVSVELDAIHPNDLRQMVRNAIESVLDTNKLEAIRQTEELERESLTKAVEAGFFGRT